MPVLFPLSIFCISIKLILQLPMPTTSNQSIPEAFPIFLYKAFPFLCLPLSLCQKQMKVTNSCCSKLWVISLCSHLVVFAFSTEWIICGRKRHAFSSVFSNLLGYKPRDTSSILAIYYVARACQRTIAAWKWAEQEMETERKVLMILFEILAPAVAKVSFTSGLFKLSWASEFMSCIC